ncbi:HAD family hydrolase [Pyrococcus horikoshii]|nr:HAD family hydrolase [Pyrococcus horikoshii]HII61215.1 HAD family hydrolase [Pyrococcus horikoshii]
MLVILDLDDTLCNTWEALRLALIRLTPIIIMKRKFKLIAYFLTKRYEKLESIRDIHLLDFEGIFNRIMEDIYRDLDKEEIKEMLDLFDRAFFANLKLYDDVLPFLNELKQMKAKLALVTDSASSWQRRKLEVLGIQRYFDKIIVSGDTGHTKLEPYNFYLATKMFPKEDKIFVIGDRDDTDMKGGKAIGATTILVKRGYFKGRRAKYADYIVNNLYEALEVIKGELKA